MILKGKERGSAKQLGAYLMRMGDNDRVELHEVSGFMSDDIHEAMREADALASGTKCRNHLFSVSLNPPQTENVRVEVFETALAKIEERTGLSGQPRVVVFHEKDGRRHCHAVWSRIDPETMTAINLPFYKTRLREVSKELYLENGFQMPPGLIDSKARDPRNFDLAEWQRAKRTGRNAGELKGIIQECLAASDSRQTFARALEERGLYLAKGDRRGHTVVTYEGEVHSLARCTGMKAKELKERLGDPSDLRSVEETRSHIASVIAPRLQNLLDGARDRSESEAKELAARRAAMNAQHADERRRMDAGQRERSEAEARERAARIHTGIRGLLDRMSGHYSKVSRQNEMEAHFSLLRDRAQRDEMVAAQLRERQALQQEIQKTRHRHTAHVTELHRDLSRQQSAHSPRPASQEMQDRLEQLRSGPTLQERFTQAAASQASQPTLAERLQALREPQASPPERGPELER